MTHYISVLQLRERVLLKVSGIDSLTFLQNILSNNLRLIENNLQYNVLLTPQGKILYDFFIFKIKETFYLDHNKDFTEKITNTLNDLKLRAKIDISIEPELKVFISKNKFTNLSFVDPRNDLLGYRSYTNSLNPKITSKDESLKSFYNSQRYKYLIPDFGKDFLPNKFFALDLEMDRLNAISFNKGCYIGQEVVAKIHFLSTKKKSLELVKITKNTTIDNEKIYVLGEKYGIIVSQFDNKALIIRRYIDKAKSQPLNHLKQKDC